MTVNLTAAQAKAMGVDMKLGSKRTVKRPPKNRKVVKGRYHTRCVKCGEEFEGDGAQAREDRHLKEFKHARYQLVPD